METKIDKTEPTTTKNDNDNLLNRIFFSKYKTIKKLGEGSFGKIFKAEYNDEYYALKFENRAKGQSLLETEATIMSYLKGPNIPFVRSYGYSGNYNILVMELLGKSLEDLMSIKKQFTVKTVCHLAFQMITILEYIHTKHIIHRDIKPDNFLMGNASKNAVLYLLDFGLAKKYRSSTTLEQYPMVNKKKLTGTARYASINALAGLEQARRDDMEAVGYVLMYFLRGVLPWQGLKIKSKEDRYKKILEKKKATTTDELCSGFPIEFKEYVDYTRKMNYTEEPAYEQLRNKFYYLVTDALCEKFDYVYDWTSKEDLMLRKNVKESYEDVVSSFAESKNVNSCNTNNNNVGNINSNNTNTNCNNNNNNNNHCNNNSSSMMITPRKKRSYKDEVNKSNANTMTVYRTTHTDTQLKVGHDVGLHGSSNGGGHNHNDKVESKCCVM